MVKVMTIDNEQFGGLGVEKLPDIQFGRLDVEYHQDCRKGGQQSWTVPSTTNRSKDVPVTMPALRKQLISLVKTPWVPRAFKDFNFLC